MFILGFFLEILFFYCYNKGKQFRELMDFVKWGSRGRGVKKRWKKRLKFNNSSIKQKDPTFTPYFIQNRGFNLNSGRNK